MLNKHLWKGTAFTWRKIHHENKVPIEVWRGVRYVESKMRYINLSETDSSGRNSIFMQEDLAAVIQKFAHGHDIEREYLRFIINVKIKILEKLEYVSDESEDLSFSFYTQIGSALVKISVEVVDDDPLGSSITTTIDLDEVMYVD